MISEEFRRGWKTVVASSIGVALGLSAIGATYTLGIFVIPLSAQFGWDRQQIMAVVLILTIGIIPSGMVCGWITDKFGVYRLIIWSQVALGACFIGLGLLTQSLTEFYALYAAMALSASGTLPITFTKVITAQFERSRGLALGLVLCGTGICAVTVPTLATSILQAMGWRAAYVFIGCLPLLVALPLSIAFLRQHPAAGDFAVDVRQGPAIPGSLVWSLAQAAREYRFWALAGAFFLISGVATGVLTNLVPLLVERGYSATHAARMVSMFGLVVIVGRICAGMLIDRFWAPMIATIFLIPAAIAMAVMTRQSLTETETLLCIVAVAAATGMELDMSAYLAAKYFGGQAFGRIYGVLFVILLLGGGISAQISGQLYDVYQSYDAALYGGAVCVTVCATLLLSLGRYPVIGDRNN